MQVLKFQDLVSLAVAQGMLDQPETRLDQIMGALTTQEQRLAGVQPALEEEVAGATVWFAPLSGFVVQEGAATPLSVHVGYSEHGAHVLHNGQVYHLDGMGHTPVPDNVWALFEASVWTAPTPAGA